jgi:hypothetical protein
MTLLSHGLVMVGGQESTNDVRCCTRPFRLGAFRSAIRFIMNLPLYSLDVLSFMPCHVMSSEYSQLRTQRFVVVVC